MWRTAGVEYYLYSREPFLNIHTSLFILIFLHKVHLLVGSGFSPSLYSKTVKRRKLEKANLPG